MEFVSKLFHSAFMVVIVFAVFLELSMFLAVFLLIFIKLTVLLFINTVVYIFITHTNFTIK